MEEERLQKVLARMGVASRRKAEKLITEGRVRVNEKVVTELGTRISPRRDVVKVDGKTINQPEKLVYVILNKPKGFITSVADEKDRPTVMDLVSDIPQRIYPVGRLDRDSEGLLLLTNDGPLAYKLSHPKYEIEKTYQVLVKGVPSNRGLEQLRQGVLLDRQKTAPAELQLLKQFGNGACQIQITVHEGRNRQVRRMFAKIGHEVTALKRTKLAFLGLKGLPVGEHRHLNAAEIARLRKLFPDERA